MTSSYHHGDLRAALLIHARLALEDQGVEGVSLREICKSAGVSHNAAYRHFTNKQLLLEELAAEGFDSLTELCRSAIQDAPRNDAIERLTTCGDAYIEFGRQSPNLMDHMFSMSGTMNCSERIQASSSRLFNTLLGPIEEGQASGVFQQGEPKLLAHACWAIVHGITRLDGLRPRLNTSQARISGASVIAVLLSGIRAR